MTNKLVIFRVPADNENDVQLVQIGFTDGVLDDEGLYFYVEDEKDPYNHLAFNQIVLADQTENGSENAQYISIKDRVTGETPDIFKLGYEDLSTMVQYLFTQITEPQVQ